MNQSEWYRPGDPALYRAIDFVLEVARQSCPRHFRPGVEKFRSYSEMDRAQAARDDEFVQKLGAERRGDR